MVNYDAYSNALANSIYDEDIREVERRKRMNQGTAVGRFALEQALAPVAPSAVASGAPLASAEGAAAYSAPSFAPAVGTAATDMAATTAATTASTAAGTGAAAAAGEGAAAGLSSTGIGLPIGVALAILSSTPGSPLFGAKKAMHKPSEWVESMTDKAAGVLGPFGQMAQPVISAPQKVADWIFGDPREQEEEAKLRGRKVGLAKAFDILGTANPMAARGRSNPSTPYDPDYE